MIVRGIKVRESNKYYWRPGNKLIDKDSHGNPVDSNYFIVIRKTDCPLKEIDGIMYRIADENVPQAVVLGYGATYYGYGKTYTKIIVFDKYKITPFYTVVKGKLYVGSIKNKID